MFPLNLVTFSAALCYVFLNVSKNLPRPKIVMSTEGAGRAQFYLCRCFNTDNIYLEDYRLHVRFETEQQFRLDYREVRVEQACGAKQTKSRLLTL